MARASYQKLSGLSFGKPAPKNRDVVKLSLKPPKQEIASEPVTIPKPEGRTVLKLRTPLS